MWLDKVEMKIVNAVAHCQMSEPDFPACNTYPLAKLFLISTVDLLFSYNTFTWPSFLYAHIHYYLYYAFLTFNMHAPIFLPSKHL